MYHMYGWWPGMMDGWSWGAGILAMGVFGVAFALVVLLVVLWSLFWKGLALWKAARHSHRGWFVALLIINTLGIIDILYIFIFSKHHRRKHEISSENHV